SPDIIFRNLKNRTEKKDDVFMQSAFLCDNCGLCNASCPARLPLCHVIYRKKNAPVSALPVSEKKAVVQAEESHPKKGASNV
ncbi:4Fe-4S dicluster domain-containing protein, partial [Treponema porcinum]